MKLIKPSVEFLWMTDFPLQTIEEAGRTCYKSEDRITDDSAEKFVQKLLDKGHFAMIEHASASCKIICDRGVTHEMVRHRLFSYAQESTRWCNYKGGVTFIIPPWMTRLTEENQSDWRCLYRVDSFENGWLRHLSNCEKAYIWAIESGWAPQEARSVLPNALKTEIVITGNLREWRHFFTLRCHKDAHPQMQEIAYKILKDLRARVPVIFDKF